VVRIDERAGETASIAEVLTRTMGVNVRSLGGLGSFSSISVRGASSGHTTVLIDGVPVSRVATVTGDLGRYELDSFSALELHRGAVPMDHGGAAVGGALDLITRTGTASGRSLSLLAGVGSFGARRLRARWLDGSEDRSRGVHASLGYAGARGDFSYFDDNGTRLVLDDDEFVTRQNNGYDQIDSVLRYRARFGDLTIETGSRSTWKIQGIPGRANKQGNTASLASQSHIGDVRLDKGRLFRTRASGAATLFAALERQRYVDRQGEIGLGVQDRRYQIFSGGAAARAALDVGHVHRLSAGVDTRVDRFSDTDALAAMSADARTHGTRTGAGVSLADDISLGADDRVVLGAGLRFDLLHTSPIGARDVPVPGASDLETRTELSPSPRLSARARILPGLALKSSAGWYFRAPTMGELFGDRGFVVGNPGLVSETGLAADLGVVIAPPAALARGAMDRVYVECAAFGRRSRDTIAFVAGGGIPVAYSRNLGDVWAHGVEAGGSLRLLKTATLGASYTFLATRQDSPLALFDGKPLPGRPRHQFHGRIDIARVLRGHLMVVWSDITWTGHNFTDASGAYQEPARRLVGAGLKLELISGLLIGIEAKNLADQRVEMIELDPPPRPDLGRVPRAISDFAGFPLPGRAFYINVEWQH
jgi:vitamin B12 transporter